MRLEPSFIRLTFWIGLSFLLTFCPCLASQGDTILSTYNRAFKLSETNNFDEAERLLNDGLEQSLELGDSLLISRGYAELADIFFIRQNIVTAKELALKAEDYCKGLIDTQLCSKIMGLLGGIAYSEGNYSLSVKKYQEGMALLENTVDSTRYHGLMFNMSLALIKMGQWKDALDNYIKCLYFYNRTGKEENVATIYNNIGLLYQEELKEYHKAGNYFRKAADINKKLNRNWLVSRNYCNLGLVYTSTEEFDTAAFYLDKAIALRSDFGDESGLAVLFNAKGDLYLKLGRFEEARDLYQRAHDISLKYGIAEGQFYTLLGLAASNDSLGSYVSGEIYLNDAHQFASDIKNIFFLREAGEALYKHYKKTGQDKRALTAYENAVKLGDSIQAIKFDEEFQELKLGYEYEVTKAENELLKTKQEQQASIMENDRMVRMIFYIVIGVFILAIISLIIAYRGRYNAYQIANRQRIELEKMNEKLRSQSDELNKLNESKDRLFSVISHDLRAPLASLDSCLEIMLTENLSMEEKDELIRDLQKETYNTLKTLDDLLAWARLQQNGGRIEKVPFNVSELIEEVVNLYTPVARHKNVSINYHNVIDNPEVIADPNQIRTVTRNLLSNAIKFTPENSSVTIITEHLEEGKVKVSVSDEGAGISDDQLKKINDPNDYYSSRGTSGESGTGVGLMLCFEFIDRHNSELKLEPVKTGGTCASFTLERAIQQSNTRSA